MKTKILSSLVLTILAVDGVAEVPRVELNFQQSAARQWKGQRFRDIIPAERVHRIICLTEGGFAYHDNGLPDYRALVQADYNALVAHLIASDEPAGDRSLLAQEMRGSRLLFVTMDNQVFEVEVLLENDVSAILIRGAGAGARINVKGFQRQKRAWRK